MSVEENKAMVHRIIEEVINKGNLGEVDKVMAPNYVYHFPGMEIKGPEGFKQFAGMMRSAFPDLHVTIDAIVGEGNIVASVFTLKGTFKGELMGMAPTGKQLNFTEAVFVRFEGGKEVEATPYANMLSFYQQLGINPPA